MTQDKLGISQLDEAHGQRLRGEFNTALQSAASILNAAPDNLDAAALIARMLLEHDRDTTAGAVASRLVDAWIRRGNLPGAWIAAQLVLEAGGSGQEALRRVAQAFGKGQKTVSSVNPRPPAMPVAAGVAPHFAKLAGDALLDAAEKVATRFLKTSDP